MNDVYTVMKKIFFYYPIHYIIVTLIRVFGFAGLGVVLSVFIKNFFDHVSENTLTMSNLYYITALLIVVPLVQAISYYVDLHLSYGWVEIIRSIFRRNILRNILRKPGASPLPVSHGQLMNIMRNDIKVPEALMWTLPYLLAYAAFSLCGLIILSSIDWIVTVILFTPLLLSILIVNWMKKRITTYFQNQQQSTDHVLGLLSDVFNYSQAIKINNAENHFLKRLKHLNDERAAASKRNAIFNTALSSIYDNIVGIGTAILLLLISQKIKDGSFSVGNFTLFIYFLGYVSNLTRLFGESLTGFKNSAVSLNRIKEVLGENHVETLTNNDSLFLKDDPPAEEDIAVTTSKLEKLEVRQLSYTFPYTKKGVDHISFDLSKGSFTVITGKIGSGKTTLLKVMLGLLEKTSGNVYWNGSQVDKEFLVPPHAAYIPQVPYLFSETIRDNILLGYRDGERIDHAVYLSVFEDDLAQFEKKLDTRIGRKGVNLSGGQQQRVAAARMFIRDAELWVMDDISSALDVGTEIRLWNRINEYRKHSNVTFLVVTQKKYALQNADQIIILDNGKIKMQGTLNELLHNQKSEEILNILNEN